MTKRPLKLLAVLLAVGLIAGACGNDSGKKSTTTQPGADESEGLYPSDQLNQAQFEGTPTEGGSVKFGLESQVLNYSPNQDVIQPADLQLVVSVFDSLITYGPDDAPVVTAEASKDALQLAESLTASDDLKTWTLKLKSGIKFSNGVDLTAQQVVDHTNWIKESGTCSCDSDAQNIESIEAVDGLTVRYTLVAANVAWPTKLAATGLGWITESGARGGVTNPELTNLVGAGAFAFVGKTGDNYTVKRNEHYYGTDVNNDGHALPYVDEIVFQPLEDAVTRLQAVQTGGVHIMQTADTTNLVQAKDDPDLVVQPISGSSSTILVLNLANLPFGVEAADESQDALTDAARAGLTDARARKARLAFATGINRNEINQKYYQGARVPAYGFIPESSPYYNPEGQLPRYDPTEAKKLVGEVQEELGTKPTINAICIPTPESNSVFTILKQQGQAIGIQSNMTTVDQAVMVQTLLQNQTTSQTADWNVACFRSPQIADPDGVYGALHSNGGTNLVNYQNDDVDGWLDAARATADQDTRIELYGKIQAQVAKDAVYIPLLFDYYGNVHVKNLSGLGKPNPASLGLISTASLYFTS